MHLPELLRQLPQGCALRHGAPTPAPKQRVEGQAGAAQQPDAEHHPCGLRAHAGSCTVTSWLAFLARVPKAAYGRWPGTCHMRGLHALWPHGGATSNHRASVYTGQCVFNHRRQSGPDGQERFAPAGLVGLVSVCSKLPVFTHRFQQHTVPVPHAGHLQGATQGQGGGRSNGGADTEAVTVKGKYRIFSAYEDWLSGFMASAGEGQSLSPRARFTDAHCVGQGRGSAVPAPCRTSLGPTLRRRPA